MARNSNGFDFSVLIKIAEFNDIRNIDDLLFLAGEVENCLHKKSQSKK